MNILREYIMLSLSESKDIEPKNNYTYEDLLGLFKYLKGKRTAKNLLGFTVKVLGGSVVEGLLGKVAEEAGKQLKDIIDTEIAAEAIENKLFNFLGKKLNLSSKDFTPERLLGKFYGVNEKPGLKGLAIPDNVSKVLDDNLEAKFVTHLIDVIESLPNKKLYVTSNWVLSELLEFVDSNPETKDAFQDVAKQKDTEF